MSWIHRITDATEPAAGERESPADGAFERPQAGSWDAHEVWLTRVKQPRDRAAQRAAAQSAAGAARRRD